MSLRSTVTPRLLEGGTAIDERGEVGFVNDFAFPGIKRFYTVRNHRMGFVRAWHGHRYEEKFLLAVHGVFLVAAVEVDDWIHPARDAKVWRFVLSAQNPAILHIPAGYANGSMSLTEDAKLIIFSSSTLQESQADDIRFPPRYWDIWALEER